MSELAWDLILAWGMIAVPFLVVGFIGVVDAGPHADKPPKGWAWYIIGWPIVVVAGLLWVIARAAPGAFGIPMLPRRDRNAYEARIAELEAELGIVETDNQDEPDKGRREVLASNGAYARPYMTPREYADHLLSKPFLD